MTPEQKATYKRGLLILGVPVAASLLAASIRMGCAVLSMEPASTDAAASDAARWDEHDAAAKPPSGELD